MFHPMYLGLFILLGIFALGDIIGILTKSRLSSVFVALMTFLVLFMAGVIPPDLIDRAQFTGLTRFAMVFLVFHMGTSISVQQLIKEWKVLVLAALSCVATMAGVFVAMPLIGRPAVFVSVPIINGGIIATQIMTEAAMNQGFTMAAALGTLIFVVQRFVGTVPASICATNEANLVLAEFRAKKAEGINLLELEKEAEKGEESQSVKKEPLWHKVDKYWTSYVVLGVVASFGLLGNYLGNVTPIPLSIWALILGVVAAQLGLVPPNVLDKGKATGIFMVATFASLIPALATITPGDLLQLGYELAIVFGFALVGVYVCMILLPAWKLIGSKNLTVGIAMAQLLAFPATFLIVNEVATGLAQNEDEKQYVVKKLTPAFVVSGFVSVTSLSVIVAGIFAAIM